MLKIGAALSFAIAVLHVGIIVAGAPAYRYFGAGEEMASLAQAGSPLPAVITLLLVAVFAAFGVYALAGAGVIRRLPLLLPALIVIGAIYALRGLAVFPQIYQVVASSTALAPKEIVFSLVALATGAVYLLGTIARWRSLRAPQSQRIDRS